jgi:hypothetical protein
VAILEERRVEAPRAREIENGRFAPIRPVVWWAALGTAFIAAQAAILIAWVSGPWFHHVSPGPTPVPTYMKVAMTAFEVLLPIAGVTAIYLFVIRPWRRERRLTTDGLLVVAFSLLWWQDPLSAYGGEWFSYNAWQVNMGSWVHELPGWLSPGTPSHQIAYPLLIVPGAYIVIFLLVSFLGSRLMAALKTRRPQSSRLTLVFTCFVAMALFDLVFEGIVFMPLGSWEYPGGHWALFPTTFHKYPLNEAITTGMLFTAFASIKYFADDNGLTLAERGAAGLRTGPACAWLIRALAVTGMVSLCMVLFYGLPNTFAGLHSTQWPASIQKRSYLTYTCGPAAGRTCPPTAVKSRGGGLNGR